jgi:ATP-dependent Clp protease protease subunit
MNKVTKLITITIATLIAVAGTVIALQSQAAVRKDADVVLTNKNTVTLRGPVMDDSVAEIMKKLRALDTDKDASSPIYLVLYTPGGSIQAGIELIESIKGMRRPVKTVTIFAASMGFQLAQSLDERLILNGGTLMSHKARGGAEGEFGPGGDSQLDKRINFWKSRLLDMDKQTVERTKGKQSLQSYQASYENEMWLTGPEAVSSGYADRVVSIRCSDALTGTDDLHLNFFGMNITVKFSRCPLQKTPESVEMKIGTNQGEMTVEQFVAQGGILGLDCAVAQGRMSGNVLCAVNSAITRDFVDQLRKNTLNRFTIEGMKKEIGYTW